MVDYQCKNFYTVPDLLEIVRILRGPGGCPWDGEQTHETICKDFLEEVYEVIEAIQHKDPAGIKEELGDVLLQVAFHTILEEETCGLSLDDVADGVCKKLIYRHPHVFGEVSVSGTDEVLSNWEQLKRAEKDQKSDSDALAAVARTLPALWRAEKVQKKAAKAGFAWPDAEGAADKLTEEVGELRQAMAGSGDIEEELGDVLCAAVCLGRMLGVDPEGALNRATDKFIRRFQVVEELAGQRDMKQITPEEYYTLWQQAKQRT